MKKTFEALLLTLGLALAAVPAHAAPAEETEPAVGEPAPDFTLTDVNGKAVSLSAFKGKHVVLEWTNPDCPFVKKHYDSGNMQALQKEFAARGVAWLSINSSAPGKQGNYPPKEWLKILAEKGSAADATLLDPRGEVGRLYGAKTTPHMFVVDPKGTLIYAGAIDDIASADPADIAKANNYVRAALNEARTGKPVRAPSTKPYGCSVKY